MAATEKCKEKNIEMFGSISVGGIPAAGNLGGVQSSEAELSESADKETGAHLCLRHLMSILQAIETRRRNLTKDILFLGDFIEAP